MNKKQAHFVVQGKGGVGKSTVSAYLAQYAKSKNESVLCFDTDPVNHSFSGFKSLSVEHINIEMEGKINQREFDLLIEKIASHDGLSIIDNGATSFLPLMHYIHSNDIFPLLKENGIDVFIHCVIAGGASLGHSIDGLVALGAVADGKNIVVWKNEYLGEITHNGKSLEEMKAFISLSEVILGVVTLPKKNADTFGTDISNMLTKKLTFDEYIASPECFLVSKQRLTITKREIYTQLEYIGLIA